MKGSRGATDLGEAWMKGSIGDSSLNILYGRKIKEKTKIKNVWKIREFSVRLSFNMSEPLTVVSTA